MGGFFIPRLVHDTVHYDLSYGLALVLSSKVHVAVEILTLPSRPHGAAPFQSVVPASEVSAIVKVRGVGAAPHGIVHVASLKKVTVLPW